MAGRQFGLWSVREKAGNTKRGGALWLSVCRCGTERIVSGSDLRAGKSTSCGCANPEVTKQLEFKHGYSGTKLHHIWRGMIDRCTKPSMQNFKDYGGRGIAVCSEWTQFEPFKEWAERSGYEQGLSIERNDVNGGYSPSNCSWIPVEHQQHNRQSSKKAPDGELWVHKARRNGIETKTYKGRLGTGWTHEQAATLPKGFVLNPRGRDDRGRYLPKG